jgi:chromosome segregation ATPase
MEKPNSQLNSILERIESKVERLDGRLDSVDVKMAEYNAHLGEHMRRSEANEKAVEILATEFKPVQQHVSLMQSALKFAGWLLGSGSIIAIIELFRD